MNGAFQASSPKTFKAGSSGPALFSAFFAALAYRASLLRIHALALPEPPSYLAHSVAG
jgi:hypothetical protein